MKKQKLKRDRSGEAGNVLLYIFVAVALLGALTMAMTSGGGDQAVATSAFRITDNLRSQAQGARSAILECILRYPSAGYPTVAVPGTFEDIAGIQCIPNDGVTAAFVLFGGTLGHFVPQPPRPFNAWQYDNDGAGTVKIRIATPLASASDSSVISGIRNMVTQYTANEVESRCDGVQAWVEIYITGVAPGVNTCT